MAKKVVGIIGSYRKGRVIDSAVTAALEGAAGCGAETSKIYLIERHIEFCDNCRACTQERVNGPRGNCVHNDDMEQILTDIDAADAIVLGSPINFFTVTAVTKQFIERLLVYAYWPWGSKMPKFRTKEKTKKALIITSSAAPAFVGRIMMRSALGVLGGAAETMGAKVVRKLYFGMVAQEKDRGLEEKQLKKARQAGKVLVL